MNDERKTENSDKIIDGHYETSGDSTVQELLVVWSTNENGEVELKYANEASNKDDVYKSQGYNEKNT